MLHRMTHNDRKARTSLTGRCIAAPRVAATEHPGRQVAPIRCPVSCEARPRRKRPGRRPTLSPALMNVNAQEVIDAQTARARVTAHRVEHRYALEGPALHIGRYPHLRRAALGGEEDRWQLSNEHSDRLRQSGNCPGTRRAR